jgi:hypothetical protein
VDGSAFFERRLRVLINRALSKESPHLSAGRRSRNGCAEERLKPTSKTMKAATAVQVHHLMNLPHFAPSVIFNSHHVARPGK